MRYVRVVVIIALLLLAGYMAASGARWYQTADFFCLYHGSRSLVVGHDPYDQTWWASVTGGLYPQPVFRGGVGTSACPGRFGYPLWTAVAMLPFGVLPLELAATLWAALAITATLAGIAWTWRALSGPRSLAFMFATIVVMSQPFWVLLIGGQMSGLELGLAGGVLLALARSRPTSAGALVSAMALKPQIVAVTLPLMFWLALRRARKLTIGGAVALAAMAIVPLVFVVPWPVEWLGELTSRRVRVTGLLPTAWGLSADLVGNATFGVILIIVLALVCWSLVRARNLSLLDVFVLSLPFSLFVTPYAWSYDHLVLAVCVAYLLVRVPKRGVRRTVVLLAIVLIADGLPWILYGIAFTRGGETLTALVPALNAVLVAAAMRGSSADRSPDVGLRPT